MNLAIAPIASTTSPQIKGESASGVVKVSEVSSRVFAANDPLWHRGCSDISDEVVSGELFQGQYHDEETNLHYNRHRYYDPSAGQFITQDPIGLEGGLNSYQYVPNPTGWVDPLGLSAKKGDCPKLSVTPDELLKNGKVDHSSIQKLASDKGLDNQWTPNPEKFPDGGFKYEWNDGDYNYTAHGHGPNPVAQTKWPDSNAAQGPTTSMTRTPIGGSRRSQENMLSDGSWVRSRSLNSAQKDLAHIPIVNSPY